MALWDPISSVLGGSKGTAMDVALKNLLASLGGQVALPAIDPGSLAALTSALQEGVSFGAEGLRREFGRALGGTTARAATQGIVGSSGHARAVGEVERGLAESLRGLMTDYATRREQALLGLQEQLLNAQTSRMGTQAGLLSSLYGTRMGGATATMGAKMQMEELARQREQGLLALLAGAGKAIPWLTGAGDLPDLFGKIGGWLS